MAETVTLNNVTNLQNETTAVGLINANNAAITTAFADVLSRSGSSPNTMTSNLDMNSNRIVNLAAPVGANDAARLTDIGNIAAQSATATAGAASSAASAASAATSASSAAGSATSAATSSSAAAASATAAAASATTALAAAGFAYTWLSSTTNADPGSGKLKFDNGTIGSVASIYMSETDGNSNALAAIIADWGASTSTTKSVITVAKSSSPGTVWADFYVTAAVTDNGTWDTLTVTYKAGPGGFSNSDSVFINATLVGDKGTTGAAGSGVTGGLNHQIALYSASSTISGGLTVGVTGQILTCVSAADPAWSANPQLGASGTAGSITMGNATSGTLVLQPQTGALGTPTVSIPAATDTLVNLSSSQALLNKTVNKYTLTTPATAATITLADNTTLTQSNASITLNTTDRSSAVAETITQGVTQLVQNSSYVTVLSDLGKQIYKANSASSITYTIAASSAVGYPIGTCITFVNAGGASAGTVSVAINSDTLRYTGVQTGTGTRTLAACGMATAIKTTATEWHISGTGLT